MFKVMKNKKVSLILLVFLLGFSLVACGGGDEKTELPKEDLSLISVEDDYSNLIQLDSYPEKIISLSPSTTEILFALGLDEEIVGVTDYCDYPAEALKKEKIGSFAEANLEKIISLSPDLVISSGNENTEGGKILYDANIQVASFNSPDIDGIFSEITRIGQLTNKEKEAEELVKGLEARRADIVKKSNNNKGKKVFYEVWHDPLMTAGKGSFMDELISLAGGENIGGSIDNPYPEYSVESLISKDPDVYLTTGGGVGKTKADIEKRQGYENIKAVKNGNIYLLDENIVSRPGPRIIDALEIVYEAINLSR